MYLPGYNDSNEGDDIDGLGERRVGFRELPRGGAQRVKATGEELGQAAVIHGKLKTN